MNACSFIGRIGRDAETRFTANSNAVTSWPVAVDIGWGDNKQTLWLDCSMWGERGEKLAQHIRKGDRIGVCGEISLEVYESKGETKSKVKLNVRDVTLLGGKQDGQEQAPRQAPKQQAMKPPQSAHADFEDDSIPF